MNQSVNMILASGSPRRKEILDTMGLEFSVDVSDADESFAGTPEEMVLELSRRKALAVAPRHSGAIILAADTRCSASRTAQRRPGACWPRSPAAGTASIQASR